MQIIDLDKDNVKINIDAITLGKGVTLNDEEFQALKKLVSGIWDFLCYWTEKSQVAQVAPFFMMIS